MLDIILNIIPILISIPAFLVAIKSLRECKDLRCKLKDESSDDFDIDEFLYSLEFNTKLDGMIVPLLGKMTNNQITISIIEKLYKEDPKFTKIPRIKLGDHITDTLRNYQNSYNKENLERLLDKLQNDFNQYTTKLDPTNVAFNPDFIKVKIVESLDEPVDTSHVSGPDTPVTHRDLSNILNNFYKD